MVHFKPNQDLTQAERPAVAAHSVTHFELCGSATWSLHSPFQHLDIHVFSWDRLCLGFSVLSGATVRLSGGAAHDPAKDLKHP